MFKGILKGLAVGWILKKLSNRAARHRRVRPQD